MKSKAGKKENLAISPSAKKLKSPVVAQVVKAKPDKSSKALKASVALGALGQEGKMKRNNFGFCHGFSLYMRGS